MPSSRLRLILAMAPALGLAFILSQFIRSVPAVIAPNLRVELGLDATQLSALPAALFLGSAIMQLPVGVLFDRFGPRRTVAVFILITVTGIAWFATARSPTGLMLALFVTGWGIAPVFMGTIVLLSRWVPRDRLSTATAITIGVGGMGMLLSATPFAAATAAFGWRETMLAIAAFSVLLAIGVYLTTRDRPPDAPVPSGPPETLLQTIRGLGVVLREPQIYALGALGGTAVGSFLTFRALWIGPYLNDIHGSGLIERGNIILVVSLAWLVSALAIGPLDRVFDTRRGVVSVGALAMAVWFGALAAAGGVPVLVASALMVVLGLCSGLSSPVFAHARALFPDRYVGRVITAINLFVWGGVFLVQVATGAIIDQFPADAAGRAPEVAYRTMFAALSVALLVALLFYRRVQDVPPSRDGLDTEFRDTPAPGSTSRNTRGKVGA
jgi:nitrate/nitrite transporter NarK